MLAILYIQSNVLKSKFSVSLLSKQTEELLVMKNIYDVNKI